MPRDPRKHQKALMKKRSKQKAASQHSSSRQEIGSLSLPAIVHRSRAFPILECWINANWQEDNLGLVQILLARQQPDGNICYGVYLVDKFCLGLKSTFANAGFSRTRYLNEVRNKIFRQMEPQECPIELASQMVYASIDYAAQFGFEPDKDFALSQYVLPPRGELEEPYQLTFGKDGKPFFVAGPYDNSARILKQLEKTAGPGNYHYLAPISGL
jgi:hypothetical protein